MPFNTGGVVDWRLVAEVCGLLIGGGGILGLIRLLMFRPEYRKLSAEAATAEVTTLDALIERIQHLQGRVLTAESRASDCERESRELRDRLQRLETAMPMVLVAQRIDDFEKLADLFDLLGDPIVLSSPANEGSFIWVNDAFCKALGRSREQVLAINWRGLIHPDDLRSTAAAETTAWDEPVWGFANRYIAADGHIVWFRWYCPQYSRGVTLCLAREVMPEGSAPRFLIRKTGTGT